MFLFFENEIFKYELFCVEQVYQIFVVVRLASYKIGIVWRHELVLSSSSIGATVQWLKISHLVQCRATSIPLSMLTNGKIFGTNQYV